MKMKRLRMPRGLVAFVCLLVCLLPSAAETIAVPKRIVTLAPSFDETLVELGLADKIVGVTTSSDYLDEVKSVERVGSYMQPSVEKIVSLRPDIVFSTGFAGEITAAEKLKALGIRVVTIKMEETEEIFTAAKQIGDIFGIQDRAGELVRQMREVMSETRRKTELLPRPRVYVETGYDPLFTCGKGSFIHDLVEFAGGNNIAGRINQPFPRVSPEFVLSSDPEVIILPYMGRDFGKEAIKKRKGWENVSAVKTGRIYDDLNSHIITIPSPRLVLRGLPELFKRIHPEAEERASKDGQD